MLVAVLMFRRFSLIQMAGQLILVTILDMPVLLDTMLGIRITIQIKDYSYIEMKLLNLQRQKMDQIKLIIITLLQFCSLGLLPSFPDKF